MQIRCRSAAPQQLQCPRRHCDYRGPQIATLFSFSSMLFILNTPRIKCLSLIFRHVMTRYTRVGTLIGATIYLQLIQNRYMFRSFTVLQCSHQHCVQPVGSDVEVVGYL